MVVTDGKSNFVNGLTADNFAVYEDGARQSIEARIRSAGTNLVIVGSSEK